MRNCISRKTVRHHHGGARLGTCVISAWILMGICALQTTAETGDYVQGMAALRSGDYGEARQRFESALRDRAEQEESQAGLLEVLRTTGAYQEALKRSEQFLSTHNTSALLHLEAGRIRTEVGDYAKAEEHLRRSVDLASRGSAVRMDATRLLADLFKQLGRRSEAQLLWDGLIDEYRAGRVHGSRSLGDVAVAAWRLSYVDEDVRDVFADATDSKLGEVSPDALINFGYLLLERYNATDAMGIFRECLEINKFSPDALIGMARGKKYDNDAEVEAFSRAALVVNPNLVSARNLLAELAIENENPAAARREIDAALAINPFSLESLTLQAVNRYLSEDTTGFEESEKRVFEINPSYGRFYYTLAENLVSRRKYREAVNFNRKAISLNPELWAAYVSLGMNLTRIGNLEEGRRAIEKAFKNDPFNVWAFNSLELLDQMDTFPKTESEHFTYRMSKEDTPVLSPYASELAEEVYAKLTRRYDFTPEGPIQIEIFPDHKGFAVRTLGLPGLEGALGVCFGKVVAIDSPRARDAGAFNWGTTLWHEFTHVITLQITKHNIPRWFSEGLSVYEEHKARPGWGDNLDLAFIKAYKEGKLLKASELNTGFTRPKDPGEISLAYYQAALVCHWIEEKYGFEKIKQSLRLFSENMPSEEVFRRTLGLDSAGMDAEYARFIDSRVKKIASSIFLSPSHTGPSKASPAQTDQNAILERLKKHPDDFLANLQMGSLLHKKGDDSEAEPYLKKAQTLFPQYAEEGNPYQLLGKIYLERQREDEALAEFEQWRRMNDSAREPLIKAADIYTNRKDWASVAGRLNLSIYIAPYDIDIQKRLGQAALESENWNAAVTAYRVLVALNVTDPAGSHYDLARALLASGDARKAKREILKSLEIAPSYLEAQKLLLKISGETGK